jgi:hypothetical protein
MRERERERERERDTERKLQFKHTDIFLENLTTALTNSECNEYQNR